MMTDEARRREDYPAPDAQNAATGQLVLVGEITSAFGIRGEVKMLPLIDEPKHLLKLPSVLFRWRKKGGAIAEGAGVVERRLKVSSLRRHQGAALLTVEGVADRNDAETFPGAEIFIYRSELPPLGEDTYYEADLVGMAVATENGKSLGTIVRVHFIPNANDVYETETAMIPAIGDVVVRVDFVAKQVLVRDIPGLRKDDL
ncbi:MAG: 16S rRNA processing protein RimM [Akkermansiaceae bacterium]|nr:16S rRNA processing protein RimM [Armatimonadota bacterium]